MMYDVLKSIGLYFSVKNYNLYNNCKNGLGYKMFNLIINIETDIICIFVHFPTFIAAQ